MARQLPHSTQLMTSLPQASLGAVASLLLCAFALLMCASHARRSRRWRACYDFVDEIFDDGPVIQHYNEMTPTGIPEHCDEVGRVSDQTDSMVIRCEQPVWKKNILMGGKCQLPDFSGVIIYDSDGNLVTNANTTGALLSWK